MLATNEQATAPPVVLDELDSEGVTVELTPDQHAVLTATKLVEARYEGGTTYRLLPRGPVGAVRVGELQVEVRPKEKVRMTDLLFLLGYAADPGFRPDTVAAQPDVELWPAIAYSVALSVERALRAGVLQGYTTREEALLTIRGRIRFGDQLARRPGQLLPIEVTYDEYTVDIAENQILLSALMLVVSLPRLDDYLRRRLWHLVGRLQGVSLLQRGTSTPRWVRSRLNDRYHPALRLAEIVLRHTAAEPGPGGVEVASFVVTMSTVFESFVATALTEALESRPGRCQPKFTSWLTGVANDYTTGAKHDIEMECDLVHLDPSGEPDLIFDAKYKLASPTGAYANADHYQMLGYCTALRVRTAWLVYAAGATVPRHRAVNNSPFTIVAAPLDLSVSPEQILQQVDVLADRAWATRGRTPGHRRPETSV